MRVLLDLIIMNLYMIKEILLKLFFKTCNHIKLITIYLLFYILGRRKKYPVKIIKKK